MTRAFAFAVALGLVACGPNVPDPDEGESTSALSGYTDGTPLAAGILEVANTVSLDDLKSKSAVGITTQAAKAIVAARPIATLVALDAVPYVGKTTFAELGAYAQKEGWVVSSSSTTDPFSVSSCTGAAMTTAQALAHFAPGTSNTTLGVASVETRTRSCNSLTGCAAWQPTVTNQSATVAIYTSNDAYELVFTITGTLFSCDDIGALGCEARGIGEVTPAAQILTNSCFRFDATSATQPDGAGNFTESESVMLLDGIKSGCAPTTCAAQAATCGTISDGCGGTLTCGTCSGTDTCGGGGVTNVCGHYTSPCGYDCGADRVCCANGQGGYDCFDACY